MLLFLLLLLLLLLLLPYLGGAVPVSAAGRPERAYLAVSAGPPQRAQRKDRYTRSSTQVRLLQIGKRGTVFLAFAIIGVQQHEQWHVR